MALAGIAAFVSFMAVAFSLSREPTYNGKNASEWAEILMIPPTNNYKASLEAEKAFKQMGQPGIALLVDRLEHGESERVLEFRHRIKTLFGYKGRFYTVKERKLLYIDALGTLGTNASVATPVLLRHLDSADGEIVAKSAAAIQFTLGHEEQVVPRMITLLDAKEAALVRSAIGTLRRYPGSKIRTLPLLGKKVAGPDFQMIQLGSHAIKSLDPGHFEEVIVPQLVNNLRSSDSDVIISSLQALDSYHPPDQRVVDAAWPLLKHPDEYVRVKAIRHVAEWVNDAACDKHRRAEGLETCIGLLDDPEEEVRLSAAHGLMSWGSDARKALPKLERLYRQTVSISAAVSEEYRGVVFRLDPDLAFELQNPQRRP